MAKVNEIRGLIYSHYDSEAQLAQELGWPRQRLNAITNGLKEPSLDDTDKMAKALDLSLEETARFFLPRRSQV